jgi:hypothetical protein
LRRRWKMTNIVFLIIPQEKRANIVNGRVENNGRKKFLPACIGVGRCRLSVCPSVRLTICLCDFVE